MHLQYRMKPNTCRDVAHISRTSVWAASCAIHWRSFNSFPTKMDRQPDTCCPLIFPTFQHVQSFPSSLLSPLNIWACQNAPLRFTHSVTTMTGRPFDDALRPNMTFPRCRQIHRPRVRTTMTRRPFDELGHPDIAVFSKAIPHFPRVIRQKNIY